MEAVKIKVLVEGGLVQTVLVNGNSPLIDLEVVDVDSDYEDYDELIKYRDGLLDNPAYESLNFDVANFEPDEEAAVEV